MIRKRLALWRLPAIAVGAAVAIGVAGCGGDSGTDEASGPAKIRVLLNAQPATLDPIAGARSAQVVWATMIEPLINTDSSLEPERTGLITDWKRSSSTKWTFTVRSGVKFSNGEPADAAAVANTLKLTRDSKTSILKPYFANVASIEATDDATVEVKTKRPQYDLPYLLTTVYLVPPKYYEEKGPEGFSAAPVGTGPYVFEEAKPGREISVKVNPDYWGDKPKNTGITFTWATEASQRLALLQSKSVDVALDLPPTQAEQARKAGLQVVETESAMKITAFLDATKPPFNKAELREAAALAINRDEIVQGIFNGKAAADAGVLNVKPGTQPVDKVTPDPAKAKELVGSSSPSVNLTYPAAQYTNIKEVAESIGASLEGVGFKVKYRSVDYGTLVKEVAGRQIDGMYLLAAVPNAAIPDFFATGFMKTASITGNCPDPKIDGLVDKAREQKDATAAQQVYDELNTLAVVDKHCYVPLYRQLYAYGTGEGVQGVVYGPLNTFDFTEATR
ncbi:extracellular solute-binding protein family 5 [Thermomonospora curvata DSM 43183]|uniref:Extracellular solute-binding protein family 5 n=1 Tax=Thermomonospora curvata (strain ATCC 19995 / DSM 43183 / JCM 3096 / KCTC 9072 / NBRC 15933 / NCIMB 10081 / Henssen B9) TaxID=471852 RepID=D1A5X5_THECD|nr:extracellular solute-binding protein family 5 [Thermomonospora curvata DSM 43183]PKK13438.1 MAG: ABC transporter substrate-binding protein [Thermomonospora sp. CIF 1]